MSEPCKHERTQSCPPPPDALSATQAALGSIKALLVEAQRWGQDVFPSSIQAVFDRLEGKSR